jgi:hypothetical protein
MSQFYASFRRFVSEVTKIRYRYDEAAVDLGSWRGAYHVEYCVIRLQDAWSAYMRSYVIASAIGFGQMRDGTLLTNQNGLQNEVDVLNFIRATRRNASADWEPDWHVPRDIAHFAKLLALTNSAPLTAAIGVTNAPFDHLRACRNFFAHKGPRAYGKFVRTCGAKAPLDHVCALVGPAEPRFVSWARRLTLIAEATL